MITRGEARTALAIVYIIIIFYSVTAGSATWQEIWAGYSNEMIEMIAAKSDSEAVFFSDITFAYAYDGSDFIPITGFPYYPDSADYDGNGVLWVGARYGIYKCENPPFGEYVLEVPTEPEDPTSSYTYLSISKNGEFGLAIVDGSQGYVFNGDGWSAVDPGLSDFGSACDISACDNDYAAFCERDGFNVGIYDNGTFYTVPSPVDFDRCSVAGEEDVWFAYYVSFFHYGNGSWTDYSYVCDVPGEEDVFVDIDFLSSDDGWVKKSWSVFLGLAYEHYSKMFHYNGSGWVPYPQGDGYLECGRHGEVDIVDSMCGYTCGVYWEDAMAYVYKAYKFSSGVSITPTSVGNIKAMFR